MKQQPLFEQWCRTAADYVPRLRRTAVYSELYEHLQDHYHDLIEEGKSDADAVRIALEAMGDADVTGQALRRAEWTPKGILRRLRNFSVGSAWIGFYRGTDENRYVRLRQVLTAAGIEFRADELDALARTAISASSLGKHPTDATPRRDGTVPNMYAFSQYNTWSERDTFYTLMVRRRDLPAAQRLERS